MPEIERLEIGSAGDADALGDGEANELVAVVEAGGHGLLGAGFEKDVFVGGYEIDYFGEFHAAGAGEALQVVGVDFDAAQVVVGDFLRVDLVVEVVIALDAYGLGLQLHVEVLGDNDDGWTIEFSY